MNNVKSTYFGLDFFKLIAAFMVVMVHTNPFAEFGVKGLYISQIVPLWGVPFFFCCSGFFLFRNNQGKKGFPWKQIKRLAVFYCIWVIIYLPFTPIQMNTFFINFFVYGTVFHLWYIPALAFDIIIISLIRNNKVLILLGMLLFFFGVVGGSYYVIGMKIPYINDIFVHHNLFDKFRKIFCEGLPFTILGYIIAQKIDVLGLFVKTRTVRLLVIAIFLFLVEIVFILYFRLDRDVLLTFLLMPLVAAIFLRGIFLPLRNSEKLKKKGYIYRSISNCVYFVHPLILYGFLFRFELMARFPTLLCFMTFFISAFIGYLIIKINNPYLNKLIQ